MVELDGNAAIAWMRAKRTNVPGMCLNTVWQAYGAHPSTGPHAGQYPTALSGWNFATRRHTDRNPPAGVPVYYGVSPNRTDANKSAGDVVISLGGGKIIGTDAAGTGRIGIRTIAQRAADISRPYLGWTEDFLGYSISSAAFAGEHGTPLDNTPETPKVESGFDMPQNWAIGNTIATVGETFAVVWTNPDNFSYQTNMAAWGPAVPKNMTGDQLTTIVAECNARGARYAAVGAPGVAVPAGATTDKQEILAAIAAGAADVKAHIPTKLVP